VILIPVPVVPVLVEPVVPVLVVPWAATTVHVRLAGTPGAFPELTACTWKEWVPRLSDEYVVEDAHQRTFAASSEHRRRTPTVSEVKVKVALVAVVDEPSLGPPVISASGAVLSLARVPCSMTARCRRRPAGRRRRCAGARATTLG
jgi:hypothetical protein